MYAAALRLQLHVLARTVLQTHMCSLNFEMLQAFGSNLRSNAGTHANLASFAGLLTRCYSGQNTDVAIQQATACLSDSRGVVRLDGSQTISFLQGMVTNDMKPLETAGASPVYAALLTPKGKFLHDCIFYRQEDGSLLMEVDSQGLDRALDWLTRYKLRKQVDLEDVSDTYSVWTQFGRQGKSNQAGWWPDPRLASLGLRTILHKDQATGLQQAASVGSSSQGTNESSQNLPSELYRRWRYMHGVAEGETEIPTEKGAPLDYNMDVLNGVSYKKGCYIGQERNSFTHYRGIIRKRCMPFTVADGASTPTSVESIVVASTSEGATEKVSASVGSVLGASGQHGLCYIKLSAALQALEGKVELVTSSSKTRIQPVRPEWWLPEWGHEEDSVPGS